MASVVISLPRRDRAGAGASIQVDGVEMAHMCSGFSYHCNAGDAVGMLTLDMLVTEVRITDHEARVRKRDEAQTEDGRRPVGQSEPGKHHRTEPMQEDIQGFTIRQD